MMGSIGSPVLLSLLTVFVTSLNLVASQTCVRQAGQCSIACDNEKTKFDLAPLVKASSQYTLLDFDVEEGLYDAKRSNYSYVFNICDQLARTPGSGSHGEGQKCLSTQGTPPKQGESPQTGRATAFQVSNWEDECHRLGSKADNTNMQFSLYDEEDPSLGIKIKYTGGDSCGTAQDRSLTINILCADDVGNVPDSEPIEEVQKCQYELWFTSIYGCPLGCGVNGRHLCNQKGACRYDSDLGAPRCFCSDGWGGNACSQRVAKASAGVVVSLIFVMLCLFTLILVCVLIAVVLMWLKVRTLRLDPREYASLDDDLPTQPVRRINTNLDDDDEKEAQL
jgi:hypothetical protein